MIEVMGDLEQKICGKWVSLANKLNNPVTVEISGLKTPISSLMDQLSSYERSGREKDKIRAEKYRKLY